MPGFTIGRMTARRDRALAALPRAVDAAIAAVDANPDPEDAWRQAEEIRRVSEALVSQSGALRARVVARWHEAETAAAAADGATFHLIQLADRMAVSSDRTFTKARVQRMVKDGREQGDALPPGDQSDSSA